MMTAEERAVVSQLTIDLSAYQEFALGNLDRIFDRITNQYPETRIHDADSCFEGVSSSRIAPLLGDQQKQTLCRSFPGIARGLFFSASHVILARTSQEPRHRSCFFAPVRAIAPAIKKVQAPHSGGPG